MGSTDPKNLVLPYNVPANEFMNGKGENQRQQERAIWGLDPLSVTMPTLSLLLNHCHARNQGF